MTRKQSRFYHLCLYGILCHLPNLTKATDLVAPMPQEKLPTEIADGQSVLQDSFESLNQSVIKNAQAEQLTYETFFTKTFNIEGVFGELKNGTIIKDWETMGQDLGTSGKALSNFYTSWRQSILDTRTALEKGEVDTVEAFLNKEFDLTATESGTLKNGEVILDWESFATEKGLAGMGLILAGIYSLWRRIKQASSVPDYKSQEKTYGELQTVYETAISTRGYNYRQFRSKAYQLAYAAGGSVAGSWWKHVWSFWSNRYQTTQKELRYNAQKAKEEKSYITKIKNFGNALTTQIFQTETKRKTEFSKTYQKALEHLSPEEIDQIQNGTFVPMEKPDILKLTETEKGELQTELESKLNAASKSKTSEAILKEFMAQESIKRIDKKDLVKVLKTVKNSQENKIEAQRKALIEAESKRLDAKALKDIRYMRQRNRYYYWTYYQNQIQYQKRQKLETFKKQLEDVLGKTKAGISTLLETEITKQTKVGETEAALMEKYEFQNYFGNTEQALREKNKEKEDPAKNRVLEYFKKLKTAASESVFFSDQTKAQTDPEYYDTATKTLEKELLEKTETQTEIEKLKTQLTQQNGYSWETFVKNDSRLVQMQAQGTLDWTNRDMWVRGSRNIGRGSDYWQQSYAKYAASVARSKMRYSERTVKTLKTLATKAYDERMASYTGWQKYYREHPMVHAQKQMERKARLLKLEKQAAARAKSLTTQLQTLKQQKENTLEQVWKNFEWLTQTTEEREKNSLTNVILDAEIQGNQTLILEKEREPSANTSTEALTSAEALIQDIFAQKTAFETTQSQEKGELKLSGSLKTFDVNQTISGMVRTMQHYSTPGAQAKIDAQNNNKAVAQGISKNNSHHYAGGSYSASRQIVRSKNPQLSKTPYKIGHTPTDPTKVELVDAYIPAVAAAIPALTTKEAVREKVLNIGSGNQTAIEVAQEQVLAKNLQANLLAIETPNIGAALVDGITEGVSFMKGFGRAVWDELQALKDLLDWKTWWSLLKAIGSVVASIGAIGKSIVTEGLEVLEPIGKAISEAFGTEWSTVQAKLETLKNSVDANKKGYATGFIVMALIPIFKILKAGKLEKLSGKLLEAIQNGTQNYKLKNAGFQKVPGVVDLAGVIAREFGGVRAKYLKALDASIKIGKNFKIDVDEIMESFPSYKFENIRAYLDTRMKIGDELFEKILKSTNYNKIVITAGGAGSGKSTAIVNSLENKYDKTAILDTTLSSEASMKKLEAVLKSGKTVEIHAVFTDLPTALKWNSGRARALPERVVRQTHIGFRKNMLEIAKKYPNLKIKVIQNGKGFPMGGKPKKIKSQQALLDFLQEDLSKIN